MTTRRPLIAGNWKMHLPPSEAAAHAEALRVRLLDVEDVDIAVFPTTLSVLPVVNALQDTAIQVGIQEPSIHAKGAYTGQASAHHARLAGCDRALVGHSEARAYLHGSDDPTSGQLLACLNHGLLPILCVGESWSERDSDTTQDVLTRQLHAALGELTSDQLTACTIAYEPIWAIGTGRTASPAQAADAHAVIRQWLKDRHPSYVADQTRILYGGSVSPDNVSSLLAQPDIDGALVGGASLKLDAFLDIIQRARPS